MLLQRFFRFLIHTQLTCITEAVAIVSNTGLSVEDVDLAASPSSTLGHSQP